MRFTISKLCFLFFTWHVAELILPVGSGSKQTEVVVPATHWLPVLPQLHIPVVVSHVFAVLSQASPFVLQTHVGLPPTSMHIGFAEVQPVAGVVASPVPIVHVQVPSAVLHTSGFGQVPLIENKLLVTWQNLGKCYEKCRAQDKFS